ncbi:biotin/lipoyl-containing protein [Clostridiaceae bacterium HSG29]|nr:biotin/lipoyl-containing protein [Clostridiaceae bacterium HSG29]
MKKFRISVNGNSYDVEVEELGNGASSAPVAAPVAAPAAPKAAPKKAAPKAAPKKAAKAAPAGGHGIEAPMPGTILSLKVAEGDTVSSGDVLLVLEAMKMENEIASDVDGVVKAININNGDSVDSGEVLVVIA